MKMLLCSQKHTRAGMINCDWHKHFNLYQGKKKNWWNILMPHIGTCPHTTSHTNHKFPENIKLHNCLIQWGQTANQHFITCPQTQLCVISSTQWTGILVSPNISTGLWQSEALCCTLDSICWHHQLRVQRTNTWVKYSNAQMQLQTYLFKAQKAEGQ